MRALSSWVLARLSRVTSSGRFIPEIDGLRFVAIMSVVLFHMYPLFWKAPCAAWWTAAGGLVEMGWYGVELFFVISGFILSMPFAEQHLLGRGKVGLRKYFLRRVTRLEPPYLINLCLLLGLLVLYRGQDLAHLLPRFLASAFYCHNQVYGTGSAINYVAWSLEIEVQFYILAPLLGCVFLIRSRWLRRGVIVAAMGALALAILNVASPAWRGRLEASLASKLPFFLVGFLLSDVYLVEWKGAPRRSYLWDLIGLAAWIAIPAFLKFHWWLLNTAGFAALLFAYMAAFRGRVINRFFAQPWIVVIGGMCYTIYLYHQVLLEFLGPLVRPDPAQAVSPLAAVGMIALLSLMVVAAAALLFVVFEKPFMYKTWPSQVRNGAGRFLAWLLRRLPVARLPGAVAATEAVAADPPPSRPRSPNDGQ